MVGSGVAWVAREWGAEFSLFKLILCPGRAVPGIPQVLDIFH